MDKLLEMANGLGEAIKSSAEFIEYQAAKDAYENDDNLQALVSEFNLKKMAVMNEMQKEEGEKSETKLAEYQKEMRAAYAGIMKNDIMSEYNQKKESIEGMVNQIFGIINFHVTGKDPDGCGGSCSSCSGCH